MKLLLLDLLLCLAAPVLASLLRDDAGPGDMLMSHSNKHTDGNTPTGTVAENYSQLRGSRDLDRLNAFFHGDKKGINDDSDFEFLFDDLDVRNLSSKSSNSASLNSKSTKSSKSPKSTKSSKSKSSKSSKTSSRRRSRSRSSPPTIVTANFEQATADNPITLFSVLSAADRDENNQVRVLLPQDTTEALRENTEVYTATNGAGDGGSSCPPVGGDPVTFTGTTVNIPLNGVDTEILICTDSVVVGRCYHRFAPRSATQGSKPSYQVTLDFTEASASSPVVLSFDFGPAVGFDKTGWVVFQGEFEGEGGGYFLASTELDIGDDCPPSDAEELDADALYPFTLFVLEGPNDQTVYACGGGAVVGSCDFVYTDFPEPSAVPTVFVEPVSEPVPLPTLPPTSAPSTVPSTTPSTLPSTSSEPSESDGGQENETTQEPSEDPDPGGGQEDETTQEPSEDPDPGGGQEDETTQEPSDDPESGGVQDSDILTVSLPPLVSGEDEFHNVFSRRPPVFMPTRSPSRLSGDPVVDESEMSETFFTGLRLADESEASGTVIAEPTPIPSRLPSNRPSVSLIPTMFDSSGGAENKTFSVPTLLPSRLPSVGPSVSQGPKEETNGDSGIGYGFRACDQNIFCATSDFCVENISGHKQCISTCTTSDDCPNADCGRVTYPDGVFVCCPSDGVIAFNSVNVCNGQAEGAACPADEYCSSERCIDGVCQ